MNSEVHQVSAENPSVHIDAAGISADSLSAQELRSFFAYKLLTDRKTGMLKDSVSLDDINSFHPSSEFERKASEQLKSNFGLIKNLSNDEWGAETKITPDDMREIEKLGFPSVALTGSGVLPNTWNSLNKALDADSEYRESLDKAGMLQESFRKNRLLIDNNKDGDISMSELERFEASPNLDVGAKQMVKFMRENFNALRDGDKGIPSQAMSRFQSDLDPSLARIKGNLDGAESAIYTGSLTGLGALAGFYGLSLLGLALPPVWVPLIVGACAGAGAWLNSDRKAFESYLIRYGNSMSMLSDARERR